MTELSKLKWQCRRGTKELDLLLTQYLETRYPLADEEEKKRFVKMLEMGDTELLVLCTEKNFPNNLT
jgi:antitoxin CptB